MSDESERRLELAAMAAAGIDPADVWPTYFGRSLLSDFELRAYLHGALELPEFEQGHSAGTVSGPAVPEARPGTKRTTEDVLAGLGAAGRFLLSPERGEEERLRSLRETHLLHTGREEMFDRVVSTAKEYFRVDAASLSLIAEDAQFLKAVVGPLREETPRDIALCTQTVQQDSMLVINDTLADDRFASNPLVVGEPHIRFYAGFPLHGPRGWNIGTLCVIDQQPRAFSASDRQVLQTLARIVQNRIDART
ncbi:GAF domain-containing protein [Pseudarthrobacter phenanthrenivorans]|uniref:GAF domain-containing protein n=1 Tax=Pseudarthrobacter phenanthrenivorans TaxID=361575 RepID=A0A3B0FZN4_PSEPS|nr:GAF domain-containing protein [Pseudarthrobacter phenanthrenivorans]RKO25345.1 GAF domain-containing protein [Pseudarthrobacter phenanthrenivorans]TPV52642.1 GAF domain-containing protein [Pseudarthrobacter phenanthrenivorans]